MCDWGRESDSRSAKKNLTCFRCVFEPTKPASERTGKQAALPLTSSPQRGSRVAMVTLWDVWTVVDSAAEVQRPAATFSPLDADVRVLFRLPPPSLSVPGSRSCALILAGRRINCKPQLTSVICLNKCLFFVSGRWCRDQFSGKLLWQPIGSQSSSQQLHWWGRSLTGRSWMRQTEGSSNQLPFLFYFIPF